MKLADLLVILRLLKNELLSTFFVLAFQLERRKRLEEIGMGFAILSILTPVGTLRLLFFPLIDTVLTKVAPTLGTFYRLVWEL